MRNEKLVDLLRLAVALGASAEGMTLDEMAAFAGVGRRTAERRRDALDRACGPLERIEDGRQVRFRLPARALGGFAIAPTAQELAELDNAARACAASGDPVRAETLRSLSSKIGASLREKARLQIATDVEAQLRAEALARQVGPRPYADAAVLNTLRQALLAGRMVKFNYRAEPDGPARWRKATPYGLLFGPRYYLVARIGRGPDPALFRLDRMEHVELATEAGAPPATFDLSAYAARSFGVFQEEPEEIVLRFAAPAAHDARAYVFHPTQQLVDERDGALTVRFCAGGLLQIAHHLLTWGPAVSVISPERLRETLVEQVGTLNAHWRRRKAREGQG